MAVKFTNEKGLFVALQPTYEGVLGLASRSYYCEPLTRHNILSQNRTASIIGKKRWATFQRYDQLNFQIGLFDWEMASLAYYVGHQFL